MEDEFNLFDDAGEDTGSDDTGSEGEQDTSNYVPAEEFQKLQSELEAVKQQSRSAQQLQQDMSRLFGGQEQAPDPLTEFATNPNGFVESIKQSTAQEVMQQVKAEMIVQEYENKHPELAPYKPYIGVEFQQLQSELAQSGKQMSDRQMLEESIKRFNGKFGQGLQASQANQQAKDTRKQVMGLQFGQGVQKDSGYTPGTYAKMNPDKYEQLRQSILRGQ